MKLIDKFLNEDQTVGVYIPPDIKGKEAISGFASKVRKKRKLKKIAATRAIESGQYITRQFLEAWNPNSVDQNEVEGVIKTFSSKEKQWTGPREFYNKAQYRRVEWKDDKPACFFEARVFKRSAKINFGCAKEFRGKGMMKEMWRTSIEELKKMGIITILAAVYKENIPSQKFIEGMGMKMIDSPIEQVRYKFTNQEEEYYYKLRL